jgi:hypothetical protein
MDGVEIVPDPPPPASLTIPFNVESFLLKRCLSVAELLNYKFPNTFWALHDGAGILVWVVQSWRD